MRSKTISASVMNAGIVAGMTAAVLVQREMENWRSPLASIPPSSADQLGEGRATRRKCRLVNWAAAETETGFKKGKTRWVPALAQPAWVEEQTG